MKSRKRLAENRASLDPDKSIYLGPQEQGKTLVLCFGGLALGMGMPPFEFVRTLEKFDVNTVFLRDFGQAWYHKGLQGYGDSIDELLPRLREVIDNAQPNKVVALGNSSGGYAALLFGSLLGVEHVIAFAPQTSIGLGFRLKVREHRWPLQILRTYRHPKRRADYFDLKEYFESNGAGFDSAELHYPSPHRLDRLYAEHLHGVDSIKLVPHGSAQGHGMVRHLRDNGQLNQLLSLHLGQAQET